MITSKDYIKSRMESLVKEFKNIKTSYSFHELSGTHSIEIIPRDVYYIEEGISDWENNLILDFIDLYPQESLCVLTDDSIIPIQDVEFELYGSEFGLEKLICYSTELTYDANLFQDHFYNTFQTIFETHIADISKKITYSQDLIDVNSLPSLFDSKFKLSQELSSMIIDEDLKPNFEQIEDCTENDDNKYSLAA